MQMIAVQQQGQMPTHENGGYYQNMLAQQYMNPDMIRANPIPEKKEKENQVADSSMASQPSNEFVDSEIPFDTNINPMDIGALFPVAAHGGLMPKYPNGGETPSDSTKAPLALLAEDIKSVVNPKPPKRVTLEKHPPSNDSGRIGKPYKDPVTGRTGWFHPNPQIGVVLDPIERKTDITNPYFSTPEERKVHMDKLIDQKNDVLTRFTDPDNGNICYFRGEGLVCFKGE